MAEMLQHGWAALRALVVAVKAYSQPIHYCTLRIGAHGAIRVNAPVEPCADCDTVTLVVNPQCPLWLEAVPGSGARYRLRDLTACEPCTPATGPDALGELVRVYAPYCFASMHAKQWRRAFAVSHFAQSLDGKIATISGDSKWIGNPANLVHAHRMRALCDGILIGARTLARDKPQLTVRHVPGTNPTRIMLGSMFEHLDYLKQVSTAPICLLSARSLAPQEGVEIVQLACHNGLISCAAILAALYQRGIHSVYIEGGARTTSYFLHERALDVVQLHIAPVIFGSGLNAFAMPRIQQAAESLRFTAQTFVPVDDGMLFIGALQHAPA
ncbi:MAG: RibD family protein [Deltaproteobacteria bacterium]|nr:RibD family protein [Deltaproteobacteria bacterium]